MNDQPVHKDRLAWAGPALFTAVAIALLIFFLWLI